MAREDGEQAARAAGIRANASAGSNNEDMTRVAILGGGPGGYEAALVASQLGAEVVIIEREGIGGSCVLTDCVPSKTMIATSESMTGFAGSGARSE